MFSATCRWEDKRIDRVGARLARLSRASLVLGVALGLAGCTSFALQKSTISTASTLTDLQYQMVLDNVAMARVHPGALPWHVKLTQGSVSISDTAEPSFNISWEPTTRTAGVTASRNWAESWTTVPVIDRDQLRSLQSVYAVAAKQSWIHSGEPTEVDAVTGHYQGETVWVSRDDIGRLTDLTLQVLQSGKIMAGERALIIPGPPPHP